MTWMRIGWSLIWGGAGLYLANAVRLAWAERTRFRRDGVLTDGEIVDFKTDSGIMTGSRDYMPFYKPVVVFRNRDGEQVRFISSTGNRPNPYTVGQRLPVRYIPGDSTFMDLEVSASAWWPIAALVFASAVCLVVSTLPWVLS
jgi:hypothetical protein